MWIAPRWTPSRRAQYIKHIESAGHRRTGPVGPVLRFHRFPPSQEDGCGHHLRSHAAEQETASRTSPFIINTGRSIAPHLKKGILVVLESTTYPGTTDEDLRAVLESGFGASSGNRLPSGLLAGTGDRATRTAKWRLIPKVIGGYTPACLERAKALRPGHQNDRPRFLLRKDKRQVRWRCGSGPFAHTLNSTMVG